MERKESGGADALGIKGRDEVIKVSVHQLVDDVVDGPALREQWSLVARIVLGGCREERAAEGADGGADGY